MGKSLTEKRSIGYALFVLAKSSTGIGVPKPKGGHTASFQIGGFFVSEPWHCSILGSSCGSLVLAGTFGPVRQPCGLPFFIGVNRAVNNLSIQRSKAMGSTKKDTKFETKKRKDNLCYREGYLQGLEDAARVMAATVKRLRMQQNDIGLGEYLAISSQMESGGVQ